MSKAAERAALLTQDFLRTLLDYDPETGRFTRKAHPRIWGRAFAGKEAGTLNPLGYRVIGIRRGHFLSHRLAWFWVYGVWPENEIDHINGVRDDNRIANLRDVPRWMNSQNKRSASAATRTGLLGVVPRPSGRFSSQIGHAGKHHYLGVFDTAEEAYQAYLQAKRQLHAGCTI